MASGARPFGHGLVEVVGEAVAVAVDDAVLEPLLDRPVGAVLDLLDLGRLDVLEHLEQLGERVVAGVGAVAAGAAVVDEVEADVALLLGDLVERHDLGGVHDGRVEAGLDGTRAGTPS
jgi:hypothetical protein